MNRILISVLSLFSAFHSFGQSSIEIENLGPNVNSQYYKGLPRITADGKVLYFNVLNHPQNNKYLIEETTWDIWYSEKENDSTWRKPIHAAYPLNQTWDNNLWWISPNGNRILIEGYYENGKYIGRGISMCYKTKNGWSIPAGQKISSYEAMNVGKYWSTFMSNDAKTLVMSFSEVKDGKNQSLYFSHLKKDGSWSQPKNLGQLFKSPHYSFHAPFLAPDGVTLYFTSNRPGGLGSNDIWMCRRLDDTWQNWSEPVNLGPPINTSEWETDFTLDATGQYAYMVSSYRSFGRTDIVRVKLREYIKQSP